MLRLDKPHGDSGSGPERSTSLAAACWGHALHPCAGHGYGQRAPLSGGKQWQASVRASARAMEMSMPYAAGYFASVGSMAALSFSAVGIGEASVHVAETKAVLGGGVVNLHLAGR